MLLLLKKGLRVKVCGPHKRYYVQFYADRSQFLYFIKMIELIDPSEGLSARSGPLPP